MPFPLMALKEEGRPGAPVASRQVADVLVSLGNL